jgi:retinoblastoma-like protein 1
VLIPVTGTSLIKSIDKSIEQKAAEDKSKEKEKAPAAAAGSAKDLGLPSNKPKLTGSLPLFFRKVCFCLAILKYVFVVLLPGL